MSKRILLLEPKPTPLAAQIEQAGDFRVTRVPNVRGAGLALTEQRHELALLPMTRNDSMVYSLRVLQPDLQMYLLTDDLAEAAVPERQLRVARGSVPRPLVVAALPQLLDGSWAGRELSHQPEKQEEAAQKPLAEAQISALAHSYLQDERVRLVVVRRKGEVFGYQQEPDEPLLAAVAEWVRERWLGDTAVQLAFLNRSSSRADNFLLCSHRLGEDAVLTLGVEMEMPLTAVLDWLELM